MNCCSGRIVREFSICLLFKVFLLRYSLLAAFRHFYLVINLVDLVVKDSVIVLCMCFEEKMESRVWKIYVNKQVK